jgi:hypothetical protein
VCRICGDPTAYGYSMCSSCRAVAVALGRPPVPVTAICTVTPGSDLYRALRQYKSGEPHVARHQALRLSALLGRFAEGFLGLPATGRVEGTVVVPSLGGHRPPPHPLEAVVRDAARLPPLLPVLSPGTATVGHRHATADAYRADPGVGGRAVLLVDDVYTSGAHMQSAVAALSAAGARAVVPLVIGRYRRTGTVDAGPRPSGRDVRGSSIRHRRAGGSSTNDRASDWMAGGGAG